jgi:hypothetical protein
VLKPGSKSATLRDGLEKGHQVATIVNLNQNRKKRERAAAERRAAENRVRFGRSKGERSRDEREGAKIRRELDNKRLE